MVYFLKINVAIALFYAFYRLFFYKDTFFAWRRTALLCFFAVSAAVPLLDIQTWITQQEPMAAMADLYASVVLPELTLTQAETTDWKQLLADGIGIAYWLVTALLALRFLVQLAGIIRLARCCPTRKIDNTTVHLLPRPEGPFSFFHWIFVCPEAHSDEELNEILTHERAHARQWHSIDVLTGELACIICWFNPFAWLMKREIRANLEYMADEKVLETGHDSRTYQYHLLGLSHHKAAATIYNSFNVLPLKKRIIMMNKRRTRAIGRTKYLMFLPLAALLMIVSNIESVARSVQRVNKTLTTNDLPKQDMSFAVPQDTTEIFAVVEQMPQFPDGGMAGLMKYLANNLRYPESARKAGTQGRVTVQFVVAKDGSIGNVSILRGVDPALDKEAIRVISAMPKWKPGLQKGKTVNVQFTVPVMFHLGTEPTNNTAGTVAKATLLPDAPTAGEVFEVVEQMPQFPDGGMAGLMQYLADNLRYPESARKAGTQGRVTVQFVVGKDGSIGNVSILRGVDPALDKEAIRVVSEMPKWKPGLQKGKPVNVKFAIPVVFRL